MRQQVRPTAQMVLPILARSDVFGGMLYKDRFKSASGLWYNDCATQSILHVMNALCIDVNYETVAEKLRSKKRWSDLDIESRWSFNKKIEWMTHHISPTTRCVYQTLDELTGVYWDNYDLLPDPTLKEFAWNNRHIHVMIVQTPDHMTAVCNGIVYDFWNSLKRKVVGFMFPTNYWNVDDFITTGHAIREPFAE